MGGLTDFSLLLSESAQRGAQQAVEVEGGWPWEIHIITIPLVFLFGLAVGWMLRERAQQSGSEPRGPAP